MDGPMDSKMKFRNYSPHTIKQKRGHHYYYQKGVSFYGILLFIVLLLSGLTALSIYTVIGLKTEFANLQAELRSYRNRVIKTQEDSAGFHTTLQETQQKYKSSGTHKRETEKLSIKQRSQRSTSEGSTGAFQSFLQLIADRKSIIEDEDDLSIIPWLLSFKQGTSLEKKKNVILIKEAGFFFIYGQVWYFDKLFAMGHLIQRKKANRVGNDPNLITLFRCIQNMPESLPNNSCFTAGIAKLEEGDELQLIIPRRKANISLSGDGTFFGAIRLL
ncbi:tumor necrosis factor ligand superfamily member 13B [Pelobates cultripes]|uniref:Tumor necrosis factor ligand superfamily member 13B n=1 Tax=Pelobates cultripes TaxID=61616 RepID=A0AAD1R446_PELCU|nr:tumor necrosis factor ligand superfamily member 13B [Pelobates cultripes]